MRGSYLIQRKSAVQCDRSSMQLCILIQVIITTGKWLSDEKVIVGQQREDSSLLIFLKIKN